MSANLKIKKMKKLSLLFICALALTSCKSDDNSITENLPWIEKLIALSTADNTGNYLGCVWLEKFEGMDVYVTNMAFGSGGVMYYYFDRSGASIILDSYSEYKYHNPLIEAFAGNKYAFVEKNEKWFNDFRLSMKLSKVVYSSFSLPCER